MAHKLEELNQDLPLTPLMNVSLILIPLLLLAVEFEKLTVLNVSAPKLSVGPAVEDVQPPTEQPLNLTVGISTSGFTIAATGAKLPPIPGCPEQGSATICTKSGKDVVAMLGQMKDLRDRFDAQPANRELLNQSDAKLTEAVEAYDVRQLYNELARIKQKFPDEVIVNVGADPGIPFELVIKVMDTARFKLAGGAADGSFATDEQYTKAQYEKGSGDSPYAPLFSDAVLAVIQ